MKTLFKSKRRNAAKKTVITVFIFFIVYIAANAAVIYYYGKKDETRKADAAIILGAAIWSDGPSPVFQERINHGIWLYQNGYVEKLILTGGYGEGSILSDSQIAKNYAVRQGMPAEDILIEEESKITQENLYYAKQIMAEHNISSVLIVSDPLHMKRAMWMADNLELEAYTSPTRTSRYRSAGAKARFLTREVFYYIGYKIMK